MVLQNPCIENLELRCINCKNRISLVNNGGNIKSSDWDGTVDLVYSPILSKHVAIGLCTSCTKNYVQQGFLQPVELVV